MATPEAADAVPLWSQIAGGVIGFLSLCGMIWNAFRPKKEEVSAPASHLVVESASMADTRPFRDRIDALIMSSERTAKSSEELVSLQRQILESNDDISKMITEFAREERERRRSEERDEVHELRIQALMVNALKRANERENGK